GGPRRPRPACAARGSRHGGAPRAHGAHRPRHDDGRQHDDRDVGRDGRARDQRGTPRRDRDPPRLQGGHLGPGAPAPAADLPAPAALPGVMVSRSHEVMPSAPEFERTSTTLVNAYVGPRIERYLGVLERRLRSAGFAGELLIMQSNGGVMPGGYVAQKAVAVMG